MKSGILAVLLLFFAAMAGNLHAQETANIDATANVVSAFSVFGIDNLEFGTVTAGTSTSIEPADNQAGRFVIDTGDENVTFTFTLPTELVGISGVALDAGATMPISFGANDGVYNTENDPSTGDIFNPVDGVTSPVSGGPEQQLNVFLGGTVDPPANQESGNYSGEITISVEQNL